MRRENARDISCAAHRWKTQAVRATTAIIEKAENCQMSEDADGARAEESNSARDTTRASRGITHALFVCLGLSLYVPSVRAPKRASAPFELRRLLPSNVPPHPSGPSCQHDVRHSRRSSRNLSFSSLSCGPPNTRGRRGSPRNSGLELNWNCNFNLPIITARAITPRSRRTGRSTSTRFCGSRERN